MQIEDMATVDAGDGAKQLESMRNLARTREHAPGAEGYRHLFAQKLFDGASVPRVHRTTRPDQRTVDVSNEKLRQLAEPAGAPEAG